jgi:hypothetical protein
MFNLQGNGHPRDNIPWILRMVKCM